MTTVNYILPTPQALGVAAAQFAKSFIGLNRQNGYGQIAHILGIYDDPVYLADGSPVSYCAAGDTWCYLHPLADMLHISYNTDNIVSVFKNQVKPILDTHYWHSFASCSLIIDNNPNKWIDIDSLGTNPLTLLPGWLVIYQFGSTDRHVEIIESDAGGDTFTTVGFNTTDCAGHRGVVAGKIRPYDNVIGIIKTY